MLLLNTLFVEDKTAAKIGAAIPSAAENSFNLVA
jgi:hypothetical protein